MAVTGLDVVIPKRVADDVIAGSAKKKVVSRPTFKSVVAFIAINSVIAFARGQTIRAGCPAEDHMLDTGIDDSSVSSTLQQG